MACVIGKLIAVLSSTSLHMQSSFCTDCRPWQKVYDFVYTWTGARTTSYSDFSNVLW